MVLGYRCVDCLPNFLVKEYFLEISLLEGNPKNTTTSGSLIEENSRGSEFSGGREMKSKYYA